MIGQSKLALSPPRLHLKATKTPRSGTRLGFQLSPSLFFSSVILWSWPEGVTRAYGHDGRCPPTPHHRSGQPETREEAHLLSRAPLEITQEEGHGRQSGRRRGEGGEDQGLPRQDWHQREVDFVAWLSISIDLSSYKFCVFI